MLDPMTAVPFRVLTPKEAIVANAIQASRETNLALVNRLILKIYFTPRQ